MEQVYESLAALRRLRADDREQDVPYLHSVCRESNLLYLNFVLCVMLFVQISIQT